MKRIQTTLSVLFILAMSHTIGAQSDTAKQYASTDQSVFQFQFDQFDRMYTLRTDLVYSKVTEEEHLRVYLTYDHGEETVRLPHHDDIQPLNHDGALISYGFNAEDELEVYLLNPRGGTPWSTLSYTYFSVSIEFQRSEFVPDHDYVTKGK